MKNILSTVLLVLLALVAADLFLNDGRALARLANSAGEATAVIDTAVQNQNLQNTIIQVVVTATTERIPAAASATAPPAATPTSPPTNFNATATVFFTPPTATYSPVLIAIPLATPRIGCQGGRSCPRPTATAAPGR
jgi:hypothetical protein